MFRTHPSHVTNRNIRPNFPPQPEFPQGIQAEALSIWWPILPGGVEGFGLYTYAPGLDRRCVGQFIGSWDADQHWEYDAQIGYNLSIDARTRYIFRANNDSWKFSNGEQISISLWFKLRSIVSSKTNEALIVSAGGYNVARSWGVVWQPGRNPAQGHVSFTFGNGTRGFDYSSTNGSTDELNRWYHVFMNHKFGSSDESSIYIDGVLNRSGGGNTNSPYTGYQDLYFGKAAPDANSTQILDGNITDVRIYRDHPDPHTLAKEIYEPRSRWDLYYPGAKSKVFFVPHFSRNALIPKGIINTPVSGDAPSLETSPQFRVSTVVNQVVGTAVGNPALIAIGVEILGGLEATDITGGLQPSGEALNETPDVADGDTRRPVGGAELGGLNQAGFVFYSGVVVGGEFDVSPWERYPISGGAVIGGNAPTTFWDVVDGAGGVVLGGGVGSTYNNFEDTATGGIVLNGQVGNEYFDIGSGSILLGGTGLIFEGIYGGGEADINVIYANQIASGGVEVAGDPVGGFFMEEFGSGGAEAAGDVVENVEVLVGQTGVVAGGVGRSSFYDTVAIGGGSLVGGTGLFIEFWINRGSGGGVVGGIGHNNLGRRHVTTSSGGIASSGTLDFWHTLTQQPEGGVEITGGHDVFLSNWSYTYNPKNRTVFVGGGAKSITNTYNFISDGSPQFKIGGTIDFVFMYDDRVCKESFACVVEYPNKYVECFLPKQFDPRQGKGRPQWEGRSALLPAVTACRQYLYLPPEDDEDE